MRKDIGDKNKKARDKAIATLKQLRGTGIKTLNNNEVKDVLTSVMQLLGLADKDGNIR